MWWNFANGTHTEWDMYEKDIIIYITQKSILKFPQQTFNQKKLLLHPHWVATRQSVKWKLGKEKVVNQRKNCCIFNWKECHTRKLLLFLFFVSSSTILYCIMIYSDNWSEMERRAAVFDQYVCLSSGKHKFSYIMVLR
jgi:hypothetical protein